MSNGGHPTLDVPVGDTLEVEVVRAFLTSLAKLDADAAASFLAPDFELAHVGLPSLRGRTTFRSVFGAAAKVLSRFDFVELAIAGEGPIVLTSRRELMKAGPFEVLVWACGTFEVRDGTIVRLVDHFDWLNLIGAGVRGTLGVFVPAVRAGRGRDRRGLAAS